MATRLGLTFLEKEEQWCISWLKLDTPACFSQEFFKEQVMEILSARIKEFAISQKPVSNSSKSRTVVLVKSLSQKGIVIIILGITTDEPQKTNGHELILGDIDAQPIFSFPSFSEMDNTRAQAVQEVVMLVGQLA